MDCEFAIWLYEIISPRFNPAHGFFNKNYKSNKKSTVPAKSLEIFTKCTQTTKNNRKT